MVPDWNIVVSKLSAVARLNGHDRMQVKLGSILTLTDTSNQSVVKTAHSTWHGLVLKSIEICRRLLGLHIKDVVDVHHFVLTLVHTHTFSIQVLRVGNGDVLLLV